MLNNKLAVDFDHTLFRTTDFPKVGKQTFINKIVASYVRRKKKQGWIIILNTMREYGKGLEEAIEACKVHDIPIDYINENYPPDVDLWGDSRKVGATIYIDDRNIGLIGWLLRRFG